MSCRLPILAVVALLVCGAGASRAADLPPEIVEDTDRAMVFCEGLGGAPGIRPGFERRVDLNGDGREDVVTDQAGLACEGAANAFCGSGGCPVTAWLSRPEPGFDRFDFGHLQGYEIVEGAGAGGRPGLRAAYHGTACGGDRVGAEGCTRLWVFTGNAPDTPPVEGAEAEPPSPATPPAPLPVGWTLRRVPGGDPVALAAGPGRIATFAAFCLEGRAFLAITFHRRPDADPVPIDFDFADGRVSVAAGFEATAGGAYVVALEEGTLAARLAGRETSVPVAADGTTEGSLSLKGSTQALRGALSACGGL